MFRALDFGLQEDEERSLSRDLESLIESLTSFSEDEGIEGDQRDDNCDRLIYVFINEILFHSLIYCLLIEMLSKSESRESSTILFSCFEIRL